VKPGNLPKSNALSETGKHWIGNYFHFSLSFKGLMVNWMGARAALEIL
jgi:hypothetical protein